VPYVFLPRYYPVDSIKWNEVGGSRDMFGEKRCAYRVMLRKPAGRPPGSTERILEDNIKMDLK
jgi:hypothetical protein